ncbi:hypothetical protein ACFVRR_13025 [Gottfriedia sp. NPDC057948]|uniref:hypothetical protein n=1 Tax=Gottfriedia sp. NPDC057948 TaxID=3346287 RepID=UPI0036DC347C
MAIVIAMLIALFGAVLALEFTIGQSRKRKYIIWGIANMVAIGPFFSFAIGITYAIIEGDGWAAYCGYCIHSYFLLVSFS